MNRASDVLHHVRDVQRRAHAQQLNKLDKACRTLLLKYNVCFAKILDQKREFLKAALRFIELSQVAELIDEEYRTKSLLHAVRCAVLAPAGPQKSRLLATLFKDERTHTLEVFPVLEAMFAEKILRQNIVGPFASKLKAHQRAILADGSTVVQRAVIEHNLLAASALYHNIQFSELALLLDVDANKAEKTAIRMVQEKRLVASIDQVRQLIVFEHDTSSLQSWDARISSACNGVNDVLDTLLERFPDLVAEEG
jgi:COP9 signalosome complex subunit 4